MRVTGGELAGRRLLGPGRSISTRPTGDRVRESLWGAAQARGLVMGEGLDLYAGVGSVGIEALSRGFDRVTFVESSSRACRLISGNLERLGLVGRGIVVCRTVGSFLASTDGDQYGFVFVDPPYEAGLALKTLNRLCSDGWLNEAATAVIQHSRREPLIEQAGAFRAVREQRFGDTLLTWYQAAPPKGGLTHADCRLSG